MHARLSRSFTYMAVVTIFLSLPLAGQSQHAPEKIPQGRDALKMSDVRLGGELGTRYQAATCNLLTRQDRYTLETFRSSAENTPGAFWWDWPGDQIGRYLSVLHVASGNGWASAPALRTGVLDVVLPLQKEGGNFGSASPDRADVKFISGNAFALRGLLDAYEDTREERALTAARRLGRYFESSFDYYKDRREGSVHEFYGHCLDGLVRLYELGGDAWALDLAERIGSRAGLTPHAHHSLSMYRGLIDLYRVTGKEDYLRRTVAYLEWVRTLRAVTGGTPENLPDYHEDEGCALADDVVVNLQVFAATGREEYLEQAEHTLVNHLLMNQFHTGGFGHRGFAQEIVGGKDWQGWEAKYGSENPGCCSLWGQWGLGNVGPYIVTRHNGAVEVNLYPTADISLPDLGTQLSLKSDFPRMTRASIEVLTKGTRAMEFRLRLPRWAEAATLSVNGAKVAPRMEDRRLVLRRKWRSGDVVEIQFQSGLRLVRWPKVDSAQAAVFDGPLCLALSSADANVDATWQIATTAEGKLALNSSGQPVLIGENGETQIQLKPIEGDWLNPDVFNPHRLRVLFQTKRVAPSTTTLRSFRMGGFSAPESGCHWHFPEAVKTKPHARLFWVGEHVRRNRT